MKRGYFLPPPAHMLCSPQASVMPSQSAFGNMDMSDSIVGMDTPPISVLNVSCFFQDGSSMKREKRAGGAQSYGPPELKP